MSYSQRKTTLTRYGGWLPANPDIYKGFIQKHVQHSHARRKAGDSHIDPVAKFEAAIKGNPLMSSLFDQIFLQASDKHEIPPDFEHLLHMMDTILVVAPSYFIARDPCTCQPIGEPIGVPLYLVFDLLSNTGAAYDLFRMPEFNAALQALLNAWGQYLTSDASNSTLNDSDEGWFGCAAMKTLESEGRGDFNTTYVCPDPSAVNRGFTSWDAFFTREVQASARPVLFPDDNTLLHSACESTVYRITEGVKDHDQFWLKGQSYSLYDLLNHDNTYAPQFIGGTVYQAFLGPQDYHRWRSPVNGTIVKIVNVPGTYYAVLPDAGAEVGDPDLQPGDPHGALIRSQAWLSMNAARAIFYIRADNADVGLMCFVGIGMAEVSTCEVTAQEGDRLKIGDQLGMFHFGGSTHTLIFRPQTKVTFNSDDVQIDKHVLVNSVIGQFSRA